MEYGPMSERILRSIERIVKNDPHLKDFTLVPTDDNTKNKSPVLYENHHLGLETWCAKYVYEYVCFRLFNAKKSLASGKLNHVEKNDLNHLIIGALLINPDVTTFWNMRRQLVMANIFGYDEEIQFSKLVLTGKPKSNEAFSYRRFILDKFLDKMTKNHMVPPLSLLETELSVCALTAENASNNYHAWTHRQWCILKVGVYFSNLITQELSFSEQWISTHVSENTGYHYRQFLIERVKEKGCGVPLEPQYQKVLLQSNILDDGDYLHMLNYLLGHPVKGCPLDDLEQVTNYIVLLLYEILVVIELIDKVYAEHESLWLHRRFVLQKLLEVSSEYLGEKVTKPKTLECAGSSNIIDSISGDNYCRKQPKIFKSQPSKFQSTNLHKILCESEKAFLSKNSCSTAVQGELAKRHRKWVKFVLGFETSM